MSSVWSDGSEVRASSESSAAVSLDSPVSDSVALDSVALVDVEESDSVGSAEATAD
ncbi:hypothetical protein [Mycolicibacterium duvalii]|uniref:Uncharacterized protein n=1 Tax=Mycolicibacterium duvalii TaxID=39688 RepID=A0A7I7K245_9MYCO|nr:hypothetical protein [Mycolicibacterium duvalii]MCV7370356.1 hypothetical protein [Mycolicibacterium duvalii]BBX18123.1 hypothetical protein MDUV_29830 [Mycolicibacterium duvalii]